MGKGREIEREGEEGSERAGRQIDTVNQKIYIY